MTEDANANPNRARDHLANERTFLAWVRTSIALLGFGILIAKLRFLGIAPEAGVRSGRLGLAFAVAGLVTLPLAAWQYEWTRRMIDGAAYKTPTFLIFGSPKGGTPLMVAAPSLAIDLPLKALVAEGADGTVSVTYNDPEYLKERHGVPGELIKNLAGAGVLITKAVE